MRFLHPHSSAQPAGKQPSVAALPLLLILASATPAMAHLGNENNTEVRVFSNAMRVVVRTSIPLAWSFLGNRAPAMADEAGQIISKPLLIEAAPALVTVTAGGKRMAPTQVDCVFEVGNDVAFVLNFKRPDEWPVRIETMFFDRLTTMDTGTIHVFDYTASRFSRDLKPIAEKVLSGKDPALSFSLAAPVVEKPQQPPAVPMEVGKSVPPPPQTPPLIIIVVLVMLFGFLAVFKLRRSGGGAS